MAYESMKVLEVLKLSNNPYIPFKDKEKIVKTLIDKTLTEIDTTLFFIETYIKSRIKELEVMP